MDPESDIFSHIPRSLQIMKEIEKKAQAEYQSIIEDVRAGRTTFKELKKERGLL